MSNLPEKQRKRLCGPVSREIRACAPQAIPYYAHEAEVMRMEKHTMRLWVALLVAILCLLASNIAWLWYINQYDFADYEYEQDGQGVNIIGNGNGVGAYGAEAACEDKN